jgi:hypothetical protein
MIPFVRSSETAANLPELPPFGIQKLLTILGKKSLKICTNQLTLSSEWSLLVPFDLRTVGVEVYDYRKKSPFLVGSVQVPFQNKTQYEEMDEASPVWYNIEKKLENDAFLNLSFVPGNGKIVMNGTP